MTGRLLSKNIYTSNVLTFHLNCFQQSLLLWKITTIVVTKCIDNSWIIVSTITCTNYLSISWKLEENSHMFRHLLYIYIYISLPAPEKKGVYDVLVTCNLIISFDYSKVYFKPLFISAKLQSRYCYKVYIKVINW